MVFDCRRRKAARPQTLRGCRLSRWRYARQGAIDGTRSLNSHAFQLPILFAFSMLLRLSQVDPGATPVLVNELDARCF